MKVWLLTWNPKNWEWKQSDREKLKNQGKYIERWSCSTSKPEIGDRVFIMRVGDEYRGIVASAHVFKKSYQALHYDSQKESKGDLSNYIDVSFDHVQDDLKDTLSIEDLNDRFPDQTWTPMTSGIEIKSELVDFTLLEQMWGNKIGPKNNLLNYLKTLPDINPDKHDGSYELIAKTIQAYSRMSDRTLLDEKDFNVVLYNSVISSRNSVEIKKEHIKKSHLPDNEKNLLISLIDEIWGKAMSYQNSELEGKPTLGMFGIGFMTAKTNQESSKKFIEMCIELLPIDDSKKAFAITEKYLKQGLKGIQSASASQILHCLKPTIFPIVNGGNKGENDIYRFLGIKLKQRDNASTYIENTKSIEAFRDANLNIKNYRVFDIALRFQPVLKEIGALVTTMKKDYKLTQNMILFGPPGTGKTYSTTSIAVAICEPERSLEEIQTEKYENIMERFIRLKEQGRIVFITFHQSYDYAEFIEGIKPDFELGDLKYVLKRGVFRDFCEEAAKTENKDKNYVFVIDEINRGNISKIFGELITLIETNKRTGEGQKEATTAKLPYSGVQFGVPKNVYIVGTMNTADRSIALLDTALRRRFDFIEMLPSPEVLNKIGVNQLTDENGLVLDVVEMLNTINTRIVNLYDREHTIGHAFFTKLVDDHSVRCLGQIFKTNVIPLLQEYFYEDYEKIRLVLGDNNKIDENIQFVKKIPIDTHADFGASVDFDIPEYRYEINQNALMNLSSYIQITKSAK
jgi:hypothetical protein